MRLRRLFWIARVLVLQRRSHGAFRIDGFGLAVGRNVSLSIEPPGSIRIGARIQLRTPHFSSVLAYSDPTHRHYFSALGVRSLGEPRFAHYAAARFRVVHVTLDMWAPFRVLGVAALANRFQTPYETYFAFLFTTMNIRAEFEVLK